MKHAKHAILYSTPSTPIFWSTPSTPFHGARQARKHVKHTKHVSRESTRARQTGEHTKHAKHASTPSSRLVCKVYADSTMNMAKNDVTFHHSDIFIVNFVHISHIALVVVLLVLNMYLFSGFF